MWRLGKLAVVVVADARANALASGSLPKSGGSRVEIQFSCAASMLDDWALTW
jgi:hypothetical protein